MPLYYFRCRSCSATEARLLAPEQLRRSKCKACGGILARQPKPPTTNTNEVLDDGRSKKRLERPKDAERLFHDRARAHDRNEGE